MMKNTWKKTIAGLAVLTMVFSAFTACGNNNSNSSAKSSKKSVQITPEAEELSESLSNTTDDESSSKSSKTSYSGSTAGVIDTADMFSERDLEQSPDLSEAKELKVSDGKTLSITEAGVYVISGSAENCTIKVEADKEAKVQLVLDGVDIENDDFPAIYVVSADKVFITTAETSENSLAVTGSFTADGDTNTDAVIFSKDDLVFNGTGSLDISSPNGNGISSKDDIKVTGGTYVINCAEDAVEANDSIAVCGGDFTINTKKDGFHAENDEDNTVGYIYIADGSFDINASSDGIQGTTYVQIDGGTFDITSAEGIEGTYVQINGGDITISASDDGINATSKSTYCDVIAEFNGGYTTITMGQGDTDGVDANGSIYVNGGTIDITAQMSSFDYDAAAEFNGGTIIVNGEEVSEIPQSMMGGGRGGFGGFGGQQDGFGERPDFGGEMPEMPEGFDGEMPERPEFNGEMPEGGFKGGRGGFGGNKNFSDTQTDNSGNIGA